MLITRGKRKKRESRDKGTLRGKYEKVERHECDEKEKNRCYEAKTTITWQRDQCSGTADCEINLYMELR